MAGNLKLLVSVSKLGLKEEPHLPMLSDPDLLEKRLLLLSDTRASKTTVIVHDLEVRTWKEPGVFV